MVNAIACTAGLSKIFYVDGDKQKRDGTGFWRHPHRRGVWGPPRLPVGYRGSAPLVVQGAMPPGGKWIWCFHTC